MIQIRNSLGARLAFGLLAGSSLGLLTGCISYQSTGAIPAPAGQVELTGSHIATAGDSATAVAGSSAAPLTVYTQDDLERSGASDLAGFLQRVPFTQVHR